ncbi:LOW QUALITY PROTEIN: germinal-center associated nuclear protein [Boleophthalmus pectinirostris]|uniref:LOW QUALITY PROTEIN: germinal-center associated nuclear protein n=1 Tax=Boleophthalmus pectinirostris TaxID=150288 RepID=UPI00242B0F35|nr:LOW QUALITY PROTEIN: germinal-center associated nuclear protein [Boleophthalmus pectinirostris]
MNPSNPFGSTQSGAFQAPSNAVKPGLFQPIFGQHGSTSQTQQQTMGFFGSGFGQASSSSPFGQASAFGQAATTPQAVPAFGQTSSTPQQGSVFGQSSTTTPQQAPVFGQASTTTQQPPAFGQANPTPQQASVFGQTSTTTPQQAPPAFGQQSGSMFGGNSAPAFGQNTTSSNQRSVFGQAPSFGPTFGQSSAFGQGFGGQTSAFGAQQAPQFGQTSTSSSGLGFSQPVFGQPTTTTPTTSVLGMASSNASQNRGFGTAEFSFKPNEALFKPIISASPEPTTTTMSNSPFGGAQSASTTSSSTSLFSSAKPGIGGFSFSQPAVLPAAQQPTASTSSVVPSANSYQFTFSQPATPNKATSAVAQPTTPSSFSFTTKTLQTQSKPLFGASKFGQTFGNAKDIEADGKQSSVEPTTETNVFARLGKAPKRKEDAPGLNVEKEITEEEAAGETEMPRQPPKRPLVRSRGPPPGLFGRALSGLRRDTSGAPKREAKEQVWKVPEGEETERQRAATPPTISAPPVTRETAEKPVETEPSPSSSSAPLLSSPSSRLGPRRESTDSLSGLSPNECTVLHCRDVPPDLNRKDVLVKHFGRFGKVLRIYCRIQRNSAIVHFDNHASAANAKKKGQILHKHTLTLHWQRKKQSLGDSRPRGQTGQQQQHQQEERGGEGRREEEQGLIKASSPLKRAALRPPHSTSVTVSSPVKKPPMARSLQFEDSQRETGSDPQSSDQNVDRAPDRPVPSSLLHLIGQIAETTEEKYRLLEQRDKILRQGRPKRADLNLSKAFAGTCPDMCPEKERYMRETRNQLSIYEVLPNTEMVDHCTAIKEYSRSSADQEEPLPHELRPLPVLTLTMDYIVTQILDQGQDNYRDWYDFVWNRTRAIRKDIIQQDLRCPDTVALIEKCTRFHIHCAHQLCEEHLSSFDPKINKENMTKCLQSLKEMYQDLSNRGVYCPREAEFRQYKILLNLNEGDILREVQQFRDDVRNSVEVKFAVHAFSAVNSNNFVRFFKLVQSASYLSSCLLHGYFNQVRSLALKTLNIAHTVGPRSTTFPLDDIVRMLMFRDGDEASAFIQQYGLNVSDGVVELSRISFQDPELPVSSRRSEVILSKRNVLIGEVVNGGPLPNPPQHTPVCSFDVQNKYRDVTEAKQFKATPFTSRPPAPETVLSTERTVRSSDSKAVPVQSAPPLSRAEETGALEAMLSLERTAGFSDFEAVPVRSAPPLSRVEETRDLEAMLSLERTAAFSDFKEVPVRSAPPVSRAEETGESTLFVPAPERQFQPISQPSPPPPAPAPVKVPTPPPPKPVYSNEDIEAELNNMVEEVVDAAVKETAEAAVCYTTAALEVSSEQLESLVAEVTENLLKEISVSEIKLEQDRIAEEKRLKEEARRKQEHEAFLVDYSFSLCSELIYEVLDETIEKTAASEIQEALDEKAARVSRCTEEVCSVLLEETVDADIAILVQQILDVELQRIHKYIKRWRDVVFLRRQLKRQMRAFPAAPCFVDPRFRLRALAPSAPDHTSIELLSKGLVNLGHSGNLTVSSNRLLKIRDEVVHQMRVQYFYKLLLDEALWAPLDLTALVMQHLPNPPPKIFWKTLLLLPSEHETGESVADRILCDWLEVKLGAGSEACCRDGTLHSLCVSSSVQEKGLDTHTLHIGVKVSYGPLSEDGLCKMEEGSELQGTGGLLMLLPASALLDPHRSDQDVPLLSALLQLKQLQQACTWHCPLPLVILVPGQERDEGHTARLAEALMLSKLVEDGLISEYTFFFLPETTSDLQGTKKLTDSLQWLLLRAPPAFPLSCQTLVGLVETRLGRDFSSRVYSHRQERASAGLPPLGPLPVITLYNAVLKHIADAISSPELCRLSWPPVEFSVPEMREFVPHVGWNCSEHLKWIREAILSLQLPEWDSESPTDSWSELCSSIFLYAAQIPVSPRSQPLLVSRLENLLERVRSRVQTRDRTRDQTRRTPGAKVPWSLWAHTEEEVCPDAEFVPWDDVLVICIDHKLKDWTLPGPPVCEDAMTEDGEILVYFPSEALSSFTPPDEWTEAMKETHREKHQQQERANEAVRVPLPSLSLQKRLFFSLKDPEQPPESSLDFSYTPTPEEALAHRVLQQLEEEKQESKRMMEQFQRWSEGGAREPLCTPLFMPSSTLLTLPTLVPPPTGRTREATSIAQVFETEAGSDLPKTPRPSLSWRMEELERQILASQEEELATKLHLSELLNIVQD